MAPCAASRGPQSPSGRALGPLRGAAHTAPSKVSVQGRAARVSGPVTQSIGAAVQSSGYASSRGLGRPRTFGRDCDLSLRPSQARSTADFAPHCLIPCAVNAFSIEDALRESARTVVRKVAAARAHRHPTSPDGAVQAQHRHVLAARGPRARVSSPRWARTSMAARPRPRSPGLPVSPRARGPMRTPLAQSAPSGDSWSRARTTSRSKFHRLIFGPHLS